MDRLPHLLLHPPLPSRQRSPRPSSTPATYARRRCWSSLPPPRLRDYWGNVGAGAKRRRQRWHRTGTTSSSTVQEIWSQQPDAYLEAFQVDFSSYKSIKEFETSLNQWIQDSNMECSIQLLINNSGMLAKSYRITEDGFDEMVQANYIGPFVLTNALLPLLKNSSTPSRVVNVTSFTHRCVSEINLFEKGLRGVKFGHWSARRSYP